MSLAAQLSEMMAIAELTVPVKLGGVTVRGYLDEVSGVSQQVGEEVVQATGTVLYLATGALPAMAIDSQLQIGAVGADAVAGGDPSYRVNHVGPHDDGLLTAVVISRGRHA